MWTCLPRQLWSVVISFLAMRDHLAGAARVCQHLLLAAKQSTSWNADAREWRLTLAPIVKGTRCSGRRARNLDYDVAAQMLHDSYQYRPKNLVLSDDAREIETACSVTHQWRLVESLALDRRATLRRLHNIWSAFVVPGGRFACLVRLDLRCSVDAHESFFDVPDMLAALPALKWAGVASWTLVSPKWSRMMSHMPKQQLRDMEWAVSHFCDQGLLEELSTPDEDFLRALEVLVPATRVTELVVVTGWAACPSDSLLAWLRVCGFSLGTLALQCQVARCCNLCTCAALVDGQPIQQPHRWAGFPPRCVVDADERECKQHVVPSILSSLHVLLPRLGRLELCSGFLECSEATAKSLAQMSGLRHLSIKNRGSSVGNARSIRHLARLVTQLETLELSDQRSCRPADFLEGILTWPRLRRLTLDKCSWLKTDHVGCGGVCPSGTHCLGSLYAGYDCGVSKAVFAKEHVSPRLILCRTC